PTPRSRALAGKQTRRADSTNRDRRRRAPANSPNDRGGADGRARARGRSAGSFPSNVSTTPPAKLTGECPRSKSEAKRFLAARQSQASEYATELPTGPPRSSANREEAALSSAGRETEQSAKRAKILLPGHL